MNAGDRESAIEGILADAKSAPSLIQPSAIEVGNDGSFAHGVPRVTRIYAPERRFRFDYSFEHAIIISWGVRIPGLGCRPAGRELRPSCRLPWTNSPGLLTVWSNCPAQR
jgi:hypothetical protein